jgi:ATPase subunit of ABC transporter with duplicated ATPase domains
VATEILEVDGGRVRRRAGSYEDYVDALDRRVREARGAAGGGGARPGDAGAEAGAPAAPTGAKAWEERKRLRSARAKAASHATRSEERLRALERERERLAAEVAARPSAADLHRTLYEKGLQVAEAEDALLKALARVEELGGEDA